MQKRVAQPEVGPLEPVFGQHGRDSIVLDAQAGECRPFRSLSFAQRRQFIGGRAQLEHAARDREPPLVGAGEPARLATSHPHHAAILRQPLPLNQAALFEFVTVMALRYFAEQKCDLVIWETGLGGRLDATNVVDNPLVTIITRISIDHIDFLGDSLEKIAVEKAGIIHGGIGKLSFSNEALKANFDAFVDAIVKAKPAGSKGKYVRKIGVSSSMGPGLKIDLTEVAGA